MGQLPFDLPYLYAVRSINQVFKQAIPHLALRSLFRPARRWVTLEALVSYACRWHDMSLFETQEQRYFTALCLVLYIEALS
jgi:hypothetical protein